MALTVGLVSLGCSKNQVDAERMLALLKAEGFALSPEIQRCDAVIINTCGFIEDAKRESIESILELGARKGEGRLRAVVVTGCLAERYRQELADELPEADVVLGIGRNGEIVSALRAALDGKRVVSFGEKEGLSLEGERVLAGPLYTAYLKVAEGCDNRCSYCAIPLIRGGFRSRRIEDVIAEARSLAARGVTELNVVAQDTTRYGEDLYGEKALPRLLRELCKIEGLHWVRVLYCYPQHITDELLDVMAREPRVVKYLDVPLQHVSARVLADMNRRGDPEALAALLEKIRERVPGVVLRTTFITGFPGETREQFAELCDFVRRMRFDRLGCFAYSREEDTPAAERGDQLDPELRRRRAEQVMELQMGIAFEKGRERVGQALEVLCEGFDGETGRWYGRSYMDAPDIDTKVYFDSKEPVSPGDYVRVLIGDVQDYDLLGTRQ